MLRKTLLFALLFDVVTGMGSVQPLLIPRQIEKLSSLEHLINTSGPVWANMAPFGPHRALFAHRRKNRNIACDNSSTRPGTAFSRRSHNLDHLVQRPSAPIEVPYHCAISLSIPRNLDMPLSRGGHCR